MNLRSDPDYRKFVESRNLSKNSEFSAKIAIKRFLQFYEEVRGEPRLRCKDLIEKIKNEHDADIEHRGRLEQDWVDYAGWLSDYHGYAPKTVKLYTAMVRSFLVYYYYPFTGRSRLPKTVREASEKVKNRKFEYRPADVKTLLDVVTSLRDRAIILMLFQSGMDLSTLLQLKFGDVVDEMAAGNCPMVIHVNRKKTGIQYRACIGRDSIEAMKLYLKERKKLRWKCDRCGATWKIKRNTCKKVGCQGKVKPFQEKINYDSPLFKQANFDAPLRRLGFQIPMRDYVALSGLVSEERFNRADKNPGGTHALRAAFSSILKYNKMDPDIIKGLMGHKVSYDSAYTRLLDRHLREVYAKHEQFLSVSSAEDSSGWRAEIERLEGRLAEMEGAKGELEDQLNELREWKKRVDIFLQDKDIIEQL